MDHVPRAQASTRLRAQKQLARRDIIPIRTGRAAWMVSKHVLQLVVSATTGIASLQDAPPIIFVRRAQPAT